MSIKYNSVMDTYNEQQIAQLIGATQAFYARHAASFSQTRQRGWDGWMRLVPYLQELAVDGRCGEAGLEDKGDDEVSLLDAACGNFRFAAFLSETLPHASWRVHGIDFCGELAQLCPSLTDRVSVSYEHQDIMALLGEGDSLAAEGSFDAAVSFGFMHHVPTRDMRSRLVHALVDTVKPGGVVAISFWRFLSDEKLARKAEVSTEVGQAVLDIALTDHHDKFLGWQANTDEFRYCHSFETDEIDDLITSVDERAELLERFYADGKSGLLNEYVVLKRHSV